MSWLVPLGLYLLALVIRVLAATEIPFAVAEPSAYYVGVARNLVDGQGLVSDAMWNYAAPTLAVPEVAFGLWLPMSTFISAAAMVVLGDSFWAAQVGGALLGSLVAPLAWGIGREAANTQGLDTRRGRAVAISSGLIAAVVSPLVIGSIVPDSYVPFTVFILIAALCVPRVIGTRDGHDDAVAPSVTAGLMLGVFMGLAYLSRQEVVWLGLTVLLMQGLVLRRRPAGGRLREAVHRLWPVFVGGLLIVVPWLGRNLLELGSPLPGQVIDNMVLVKNEDIFAFSDAPSVAAYLSQGVATVLLNPLEAAFDGVLNVLLLPPFPVGLAGAVTLIAMWRAPFLRRPNALMAVLVSGLLTFLTTVLLFPIATLWGTFMHASGALLIGLAVVAAVGGDALLARISTVREWERPNIIVAPIALVSMALLMTGFQVVILSTEAESRRSRMESVAAALEQALPGESDRPRTFITDHPMWLAEASSEYAIALPDEDVDSLLELASTFGTQYVVVIDGRGRYPETLLDEQAQACLAAPPELLEASGGNAWLFRLAPDCGST
jgi:hypothetical protein